MPAKVIKRLDEFDEPVKQMDQVGWVAGIRSQLWAVALGGQGLSVGRVSRLTRWAGGWLGDRVGWGAWKQGRAGVVTGTRSRAGGLLDARSRRTLKTRTDPRCVLPPAVLALQVSGFILDFVI